MFQTIDDKGTCIGVYSDGEIYLEKISINLDKTWNYVDFLKGKTVEYAQIYANGSSLEECCPKELKSSFDEIKKKLTSHLKSLNISKINLNEACLFQLTPRRFLKELCEVKNKITGHVFDSFERPKEYEFYREFTEFISDVGSRKLSLDKDLLKGRIYTPQGKKLWEKVNSGQDTIKFNMFSSVTGRLTVTERSFPILNLNTKFRDIIKPTNDWYVSLDLNAAEMRVALALAGEGQPEGDLHEHVKKEIFGEDYTRTQAKNISTQWLYDAFNEETQKFDSKLSSFYNKEKLFSEYRQNGHVLTPFNRKIECDKHHFISYLCQSTLIDLFHRQILKIYKLLENKKSFVAFPLHDQVVIDLDEMDKNLLPDIIKTLSDTPYGTFPVKVEIGPNFGNMKKVNIKV